MASTLNAERSALEQTLTLESGLNDAVLAARRQALVGFNDALHASDTTRFEMNYLITTAGANTTLEKRLTSLFGTFQMATRRSMASTSYDSDVLDDFYASDVDWSIQTNRLRQQWYAANGSAKNAFNVAVRSASTTRQTRLLNAGTKYNVDVFDADEIYAKATTAADSVRTLASFNASAERLQSTLRAISDKLYREAADEAFFNAEQWALDEQTLDSIATELAAIRNAAKLTDEDGEIVLKNASAVTSDFSAITAYFTNIDASITVFDSRTAEYAAPAETSSSESTENSEADSLSVAARRGARAESNKNLYDSEVTAVSNVYTENFCLTQNNWALTCLDSLTVRNDSITKAGDSLQNAQKTAQDNFFLSLTDATTNFSDVTLQNALTLAYNQEQIDLFGVTVPTSGIFSNPTRDYEVCFVAGTPVLMADGTKRPIETLRSNGALMKAPPSLGVPGDGGG